MRASVYICIDNNDNDNSKYVDVRGSEDLRPGARAALHELLPGRYCICIYVYIYIYIYIHTYVYIYIYI